MQDDARVDARDLPSCPCGGKALEYGYGESTAWFACTVCERSAPIADDIASAKAEWRLDIHDGKTYPGRRMTPEAPQPPGPACVGLEEQIACVEACLADWTYSVSIMTNVPSRKNGRKIVNGLTAVLQTLRGRVREER